MSSITIGIGECQLSKEASDVLITHALGSCIAILICDPVAKVAGLLHYMLPESSLDLDKAKARPFVFADTGIPLLFQKAYALGAVKSRLSVMAAGGAQMLDPNGTFNIGKRNHLAMRKIFWKAGVIVHNEEVGGTSSRTIRIEVGTGMVRLRTQGEPERDIMIHTKKSGVPSGL